MKTILKLNIPLVFLQFCFAKNSSLCEVYGGEVRPLYYTKFHPIPLLIRKQPTNHFGQQAIIRLLLHHLFHHSFNLLSGSTFKLSQFRSEVDGYPKDTSGITQSLCYVDKYPRCYSSSEDESYKGYHNSTNHHSYSSTVLYPVLSILFHK